MTRILPRTKTPELTFELVSGESWSLGAQSPDAFTMVVFYRGYHCPVCQNQLEDLQKKLTEFEELGVNVVAVSMDSKERAQKSHDEWEISDVPLGYGLEESVAREWDLFMSAKLDRDASRTQETESFSEPGLFLIRPDGTLYFSSIQTMPFARPQFREVIGAIKFVTEKDYPARGELK